MFYPSRWECFLWLRTTCRVCSSGPVWNHLEYQWGLGTAFRGLDLRQLSPGPVQEHSKHPFLGLTFYLRYTIKNLTFLIFCHFLKHKVVESKNVLLSSVMQKRPVHIFCFVFDSAHCDGTAVHCGKFITEFREIEGREEVLCSEIVQRLNLSKNSEFIPYVDLNTVSVACRSKM